MKLSMILCLSVACQQCEASTKYPEHLYLETQSGRATSMSLASGMSCGTASRVESHGGCQILLAMWAAQAVKPISS